MAVKIDDGTVRASEQDTAKNGVRVDSITQENSVHRQHYTRRSTATEQSCEPRIKLLQWVTKSMSVLSDRIMKLVKGPDVQLDRPKSDHIKAQDQLHLKT